MGIFRTDADNIRDKLKGWTPDTYSSETSYEKSVYEFLNVEFPSEVFHRQYAMANTKADIFVDFTEGVKVVVEVKYNLKSRNQYHRILGQIWTYVDEWKSNVVLIVCGESDPSLIKLLKRYAKFITENKSKVRVIEA